MWHSWWLMSVLSGHVSVGQTPCTHPILDTEKWDASSKKHSISSNGLAAPFSSSFALLMHDSHLLTFPFFHSLWAYSSSCNEVSAASEHVLHLHTGPWQGLGFLCGRAQAAFCQLGPQETKKRLCHGKIKISLKNWNKTHRWIPVPIPATWDFVSAWHQPTISLFLDRDDRSLLTSCRTYFRNWHLASWHIPWWLCHTPWSCLWLCRGYSWSGLPDSPLPACLGTSLLISVITCPCTTAPGPL